MAKYYFSENVDESCYKLGYFISLMNELDISEMVLFEAEIETDTEYFYCREYQEVGIKGEGTCGKFCEKYSPRNGKNGRCKYSANCYIPTDKKIILSKKDGRIFKQ